jgi:hypothetical protein
MIIEGLTVDTSRPDSAAKSRAARSAIVLDLW